MFTQGVNYASLKSRTSCGASGEAQGVERTLCCSPCSNPSQVWVALPLPGGTGVPRAEFCCSQSGVCASPQTSAWLQNVSSPGRGLGTGWLWQWGGQGRLSWDLWGPCRAWAGPGLSPSPLQHLLPMKSSLSARVHWNTNQLGASVVVCSSAPAAQTHPRSSPQEKPIKREGRENQTDFPRPQNFSDIHFKVFIAAFHPPARLLGLLSLPGNRWDTNLFLAVCLL